MSEKQYKVLELKSSDNPYLHKDFHGALCYAINYLDEKFGTDATADYIKQIGKEFFFSSYRAIEKRRSCSS